MFSVCLKPNRYEDPKIAAFCVSYPWFCLVIALSLLCTLSFHCPTGCALIDCNTGILTDDFDPKKDHGRHVHHNMTLSCTCGDGSCDSKVPTHSSVIQIVFGVLFAIVCIVGFYLNSCVLDFGLFEFEGGLTNYFVKSYLNYSTPWKYLIRTCVVCLVVGFALSFVSPLSVVLINAGLVLLLFIVYIHLQSKKSQAAVPRQDVGLVQHLYWLLPLRPRTN